MTSIVCKKNFKTIPLLLSASFGSIFSVIYPLLSDYNYIVKTLLGGFMVLMLKKYKSVKEYLYILMSFYLISFSLAGVVVLLSSYTQTDLTNYNGKLQLFPFCIALGGLIIAVTVKMIVNEFYKKRNIHKLIYAVEVMDGEKCFMANAYYDSGNQLQDPESGMPMVIISKRLYEKIGVDIQGDVAIKTLAGIKDIPTVPFEFKIYFQKGMNKIYKVKAGIVADMNEEYDIILHTDMTGEMI
jgi:stage II sporulation protein GA (sporulation sigma-E factor processing peptidase)